MDYETENDGIKNPWQAVWYCGWEVTARMKVPGGWIYRHDVDEDGPDSHDKTPKHVALVFVPDPAGLA